MARGDDIGGAEIRTAAELEDLTVVFSGRLSEVTRSEVTELVEAHGARVTDDISEQSDLLVVGDNPGDEKLTFFADHDLPSLAEAEFYALFPDRFGHVDGVPEASADGASEDAKSEAADESAGESDPEPTETVNVEIEPVVLQLATIEAKRTDRALDSVVAESTQSLLKEVIDGEALEVDDGGEDADPVEIALPENLHAMVETAVATTTGVESVAAFVAEACRVDFGFDFAEKQELTLGLPNQAVTALKQLAAEDDRCVEDLARDLLCDGLEDALTASE